MEAKIIRICTEKNAYPRNNYLGMVIDNNIGNSNDDNDDGDDVHELCRQG
jgi:hypothetical protein